MNTDKSKLNRIIQDLGWKTYDALQEYIIVHNVLFKWRWKSLLAFIPIRYFYKNINCIKELNKLECVIGNLEEIMFRTIETQLTLDNIENQLNQFSNQLADYQKDLRDTMLLLKNILVRMELMRAGKSNYLWSEYRYDLNGYKKSVNVYKGTGVLLMKMWKDVESHEYYIT